jgi:F0F1-type ATP synthase membrane subunit b/b'
MSETSKTTMNEMMAGDGSSLALPPAFVFVNTNKKKKSKWKGDKPDKIDGRKKGARKLIQRVMSRRKTKMVEDNREIIAEAVSDTEKAQKQIKASKEMRAKRDLQAKRSEAKRKMSDKSDEMNTLLRARMSDFKKKAAEKQQKADKQVHKNSYDPQGNVISEMDTMDWNKSPVTGAIPRGGSAGGVDVFTTAMKVAEEGSAYGRDPETSFANLVFNDGTAGRIGVFDAKRILATYENLSAENRDKFRVMLNMSNSSYQKALDFAIRNIPGSY